MASPNIESAARLAGGILVGHALIEPSSATIITASLFTLMAPPISGLYRRVELEVNARKAVHRRREANLRRGVFDLKNGYDKRDTEFDRLAGDFLDQLQTIEDGRKLVDHAKSRGVAIRQANWNETNVFLYDHAKRLITIPLIVSGETHQTIELLVQGLVFTTIPFGMSSQIPASEGRATGTILGIHTTTTILSLAWQLKENEKPDLWRAITHIWQKGEATFSPTEKFEMAMRAVDNDLKKAVPLFMEDWCKSLLRQTVLPPFEIKDRFKMPKGFANRLIWAAFLVPKAFDSFLHFLYDKGFNFAAGITVARLPGKITAWSGYNYLENEAFDILPLGRAKFDKHNAVDKYLKEMAIVDQSAFGQSLLRFIDGEAMKTRIADFRATTGYPEGDVAVIFQTPSEVIKEPDSFLNHMPSDEPRDIQALWSLLDTMPSPQREWQQYVRYHGPMIIKAINSDLS